MELQKQVLLSYSMVFLYRHYKTEDVLAHVPLSRGCNLNCVKACS